MAVRFAIGYPFEPAHLAEFTQVARAADEAGAAMVMTGDSPALLGDTYVGMTYLAQNTQRCRIGTLITNPVTRHPAVTASAIATIDAIAPGRTFLGMGSGDSGVYNIGLRPGTQAELAAYITTLRELWTHGESTWAGTRVRYRWSHRTVPIYLAPGGPKGLRLAGAIADGVVIENGLTAPIVEESLAHLAAGAADAGRDVDGIDVWWHARASLADTRDEAVHMIRSALAGIANRALRFGQTGKGIPPELRGRFGELTSRYSLMHHEEHQGMPLRNADLLDELNLRDYVVERWGMVGNADDWLARLAELERRGVHQVALTLLMADKLGFVQRLAAEVIPRLPAA